MTAQRVSVFARIVSAPIHGYRKFISPILPPTCRFYPSCSTYAIEALATHGVFRGLWLTVRRLARCGPWHPGGLDPVPSSIRVSERTSQRSAKE